MAIKVCIEVDDQGQFTVGVDSGDQEAGGEQMGMAESQEDAGMKPAASVDEALQIARDLLTNPQAQAAQAKPDQNEMWNRVQRDRAMANQPGGPMMGKM